MNYQDQTRITERLILRPTQHGDLDVLHDKLFGDSEVMRYFDANMGFDECRAFTYEESRRWLDDYVALASREGFGPWVYEWKATNRIVGWGGIEYSSTDEPPTPELLFLVDKDEWNCGIATEAARTAVDYAMNELNITHIEAHALKENLASIRVLEKTGMVCYKSDARKRYFRIYAG